MRERRVTVSFLGEERAATVAAGGSLLGAARAAGVEIVATCGGRGRCRSCRVQHVAGVLPPPTLADVLQLGEEEIREGYRLSCQYALRDDVTVKVAATASESAFQILVDTDPDPDRRRRDGEAELDCGVTKRLVHPEPPADERRQTSDLDELRRCAGAGAAAPVTLDALRRLPRALRQAGPGLTVTTIRDAIASLEPGDTTGEIYGIAFDVGTTTVVGYLLDLRRGESLATVSGLNPQAAYGGDVMSRIAFAAEDPGNVARLRGRIVGLLNEQIGLACAEAGVARERIYRVAVVGNTCMHHLLLGIDPSHVGRAPYAPVMRDPYRGPAREAGLRAHRAAELIVLPLVAGFVGADTVAMILSTRIDAGREPRLAVDIGTNAEVVMGGGDRLLACSSPAGPALEGGQIRDGMRAALGAVERVWIEDDVRVRTVGDVAPVGICGSGLVDAVAALLDAGIVAPSGRLLGEPPAGMPEALGSRIRRDREGVPEFVLVRAEDGASGREVRITQADIRQLQLAKAAISSGISALQAVAGVGDDGIAELLLSGGFGNYLGIRSARRIGMIPDLAPSRVRYVGNAAGLGAQLALLSERERERAETLARRVTHVSLPGHPGYQELFVDSIPFPAAVAERGDA